MAEFHTDALRPSSLPTASLGRRHTSATGLGTAKDSDAELDKVAEDWNLRIDKEMKALTGGLGELVELADIKPNPDTTQLQSLHLKLKTSQLIRSAQSIRDIAHELKLMLLLSDQAGEVSARDREAREVGIQVEEGRRGVAEVVGRLLAGQNPNNGKPNGEVEMDGEGMEVDARDVEPISIEDTGPEGQDGDEDEDEDEDDGFEQVA